MKIIHHNDNDGYCSAAIINAFLTDMYNNPSENDFYVYSYNMNFEQPEVRENETVYIVDIALDEKIFAFISYCVSVGARVIHIDHHKATIDFINSKDVGEIMKQITSFYEIGVSASLMTYAYSCMDKDERKNTTNVKWTDSDTGEKLLMKGRTYSIPLSIRYVNDYDVWNWKFGKNTSYFQLGLFMTSYNNKPFTKEWLDLVTNDSIVIDIINDGEIAYRYRERLYGISIRKGFIASFNNKNSWCVVNSDFCDSQLYGEYAEQFSVCCAVQYYGEKWVYHIRSSEQSDVDCNEIAKSFGGGGHIHAAGFSDDGTVFKQLLDSKIKTMHDFIHEYEEAKRELEEEVERLAEEKQREKERLMREKFLKGIE